MPEPTAQCMAGLLRAELTQKSFQGVSSHKCSQNKAKTKQGNQSKAKYCLMLNKTYLEPTPTCSRLLKGFGWPFGLHFHVSKVLCTTPGYCSLPAYRRPVQYQLPYYPWILRWLCPAQEEDFSDACTAQAELTAPCTPTQLPQLLAALAGPSCKSPSPLSQHSCST